MHISFVSKGPTPNQEFQAVQSLFSVGESYSSFNMKKMLRNIIKERQKPKKHNMTYFTETILQP